MNRLTRTAAPIDQPHPRDKTLDIDEAMLLGTRLR